MKGLPFRWLLPALLLYVAAFLVMGLVPLISDVEGALNGLLCLAPLITAIGLLLSVERATVVNRVAVRRFQSANAAAPFLNDYAPLFALAVAGSIMAAVLLTTAYDHVLNTSSDSNNDLRVPIIWGIGTLLVPLVPILLGWGTVRLIRKHYNLATRQSWTVFAISLIPDLILFLIAVVLFVTVIVPLIEEFGRAVS